MSYYVMQVKILMVLAFAIPAFSLAESLPADEIKSPETQGAAPSPTKGKGRESSLSLIDKENHTAYSEQIQITLDGLRELKRQGRLMVLYYDDGSSSQTSLDSYIQKFESLCNDRDYDDLIYQTKKSDTQFELTFVCAEDKDSKTSKVQIFKVSLTKGEKGQNLISDFSMTPPVEVAEPTNKNKNDMTDSKFSPRLATAVSASTFAVGALASAATARSLTPGEPDKPLHSGFSFGMTSVGANYLHYYEGLSPCQSAAWGAAGSFAVGAAKEVIDSGTGGHGSMGDIKANTQGVALGFLLNCLQFTVMEKYNPRPKSNIKLNIIPPRTRQVSPAIK